MNIVPVRDTHAIESVSFGVEWLQPLPPTVMATLESVYEAVLKDKLPSKRAMQHVSFEFNSEGGNAVKQGTSSGWVSELYAPDGSVSWSMTLTPNMLSVSSMLYTGWSEVLNQALSYMRPFLPLIAISSGGITALGLQYVDAFDVRGDLKDFRPEMVLNKNAQGLPRSVFDRSSLWHAHHGYFTELEGTPARRRLTVANTDFIGEEGAYQLRILALHRTLYNVPLTDQDFSRTELESPLLSSMQDMHNENKAVLRDLLNEEIQRRVGLHDEGGRAQ